MNLDGLKSHLGQTAVVVPSGRVDSVVGLTIWVRMPGVRVGDAVLVHRRCGPLFGEVVGVQPQSAVVMGLGHVNGIAVDDEVTSLGGPYQVRVSEGLVGRIVDGLGQLIDGGPELVGGAMRGLDVAPPAALTRKPIVRPLATGVRVIDGLLTMGEGQRVGLFAGSGVGKSTLLGQIARGTSADVVVVGLIGERGREVGDFVQNTLGASGLAKAVVVVATSDASAMERLRAAQVATSIAEYFRDLGGKVLLLMDSITRFARAQREVGLAAGEPPARRGYPPSVFAMLPRLLERVGQSARGSISAIYTVLVEGGDMDEPVADEVRGILDGHVVLDRTIASRGCYPAVDVLQSLSRVMSTVASVKHVRDAQRMRRLMAAYESKRDLITLGAYVRGADAQVDEAIEKMPKIEAFLQQRADELTAESRTIEWLREAVH